MESKKYLSKYGKPLAVAGSAGVAGFAAIDQALQGDTQMMEILAENSEMIDAPVIKHLECLEQLVQSTVILH